MADSLSQAIGNPNDYRHTGHTEKAKGDAYCPCGQKIIHLFEIINEYTGTRFMIGSICAKRVGIYVGKLCETCNEPNKMKTNHCEQCRKKCPLHKKYHESNITHASKSMIFKFGKHAGQSPDDLLGKHDDYLIWIANRKDWKNEAQRQYIIDNLLPQCCQCRFKKYPSVPLAELKAQDPKYFEYMRSTDKGCYLQYI